MQQDELKERLLEIPLESLRAFVQRQPVNVPDDPKKLQLVDLILHDPEASAAAIRELENASLLDVRTVHRMARSLKSDLKNTGDEYLERMTEEYHKYIGELRDAGKTAFQGALGVIGLIVALLSAGWVFEIVSVRHHQSEVNGLSRIAMDVLQGNLALAKNYEEVAVREIMRDTERLMEEITRSLQVVDGEDWYLVRDNEARLRQLLDISRQHDALREVSRISELKAADADDKDALRRHQAFIEEYQPILAALIETQLALRSLELIKKDRSLTKLNWAYNAWATIPIRERGYDNVDFNDFARILAAHRHNVVGLLELYRFENVRAPSVLDEAESRFKRASGGFAESKKFPQPDSNVGHVHLKRLETSEQNESLDDLLSHAQRASTSFASALAKSSSGKPASIILNNAAYAKLVESQLRETYFFYEDAPDLWSEYFVALYRQASLDRERNPSGTFNTMLWDKFDNLTDQFEKALIRYDDPAVEREAKAPPSSVRPETSAGMRPVLDEERAKSLIPELLNALNRVIRLEDLSADRFLPDEPREAGVVPRRKIVAQYRDKGELPDSLRQQFNRWLIFRGLEGIQEDVLGRKAVVKIKKEIFAPYLSPKEYPERKESEGNGWSALEEAEDFLDKALNQRPKAAVVTATRMEAYCQKIQYLLGPSELRRSTDPLLGTVARMAGTAAEPIKADNPLQVMLAEVEQYAERTLQAGYEWPEDELRDNRFCAGIGIERLRELLRQEGR